MEIQLYGLSQSDGAPDFLLAGDIRQRDQRERGNHASFLPVRYLFSQVVVLEHERITGVLDGTYADIACGPGEAHALRDQLTHFSPLIRWHRTKNGTIGNFQIAPGLKDDASGV